MEKIGKRIGKKIKKARVKLNLTQEKVAEEVGVTASFIGMLERGEKNPSIQILEKVASALGVSIGYLTNDDQDEIETASLRKRKLIKKIYELEADQIDALSKVAETLGSYKTKKRKKK